MNGSPTPLLVLDLLGTFAFALNGGLTAVRVARVDIVGVLTLGMITAMGGGIIRDILLGDVPPATFRDWRYLAVAAAGALIAFAFSWLLNRLTMPIEILDAVGLSVFAVTGASKAIEFGLGPAQAIILGTITAVGGGTIRDALILKIPSVMNEGLYAIPALVAATITVIATLADVYGVTAAIIAAVVCWLIRIVGVFYKLNAPQPPGLRKNNDDGTEESGE
ncbi:MAG: trimeric intracellular cation channel family protein [Yaniella sp.]|uniref:trimeric intracellular cation channel family protein n=1 Tax=Yaniella sp. TaxID=2773929 RepID=UPI002649A17F|nr:trimeric intracellular cation channel family protein [Yaniella sp.]MDN5731612.1 trimeric intracellular cation channel family protein [Yaniella sp.]